MSRGPDPDPEPEPPVAPPPELGVRGRSIAIVLWCSFLAASVATMISFALVDPAPIAAALPWAGPGASRTTVYSLGFFYFWAICAVAGGLTAFMLSTPAAVPPSTYRSGDAATSRSRT